MVAYTRRLRCWTGTPALVPCVSFCDDLSGSEPPQGGDGSRRDLVLISRDPSQPVVLFLSEGFGPDVTVLLVTAGYELISSN